MPSNYDIINVQKIEIVGKDREKSLAMKTRPKTTKINERISGVVSGEMKLFISKLLECS